VPELLGNPVKWRKGQAEEHAYARKTVTIRGNLPTNPALLRYDEFDENVNRWRILLSNEPMLLSASCRTTDKFNTNFYFLKPLAAVKNNFCFQFWTKVLK
jgi:hypothetical protein